MSGRRATPRTSTCWGFRPRVSWGAWSRGALETGHAADAFLVSAAAICG